MTAWPPPSPPRAPPGVLTRPSVGLGLQAPVLHSDDAVSQHAIDALAAAVRALAEASAEPGTATAPSPRRRKHEVPTPLRVRHLHKTFDYGKPSPQAAAVSLVARSRAPATIAAVRKAADQNHNHNPIQNEEIPAVSSREASIICVEGAYVESLCESAADPERGIGDHLDTLYLTGEGVAVGAAADDASIDHPRLVHIGVREADSAAQAVPEAAAEAYFLARGHDSAAVVKLGPAIAAINESVRTVTLRFASSGRELGVLFVQASSTVRSIIEEADKNSMLTLDSPYDIVCCIDGKSVSHGQTLGESEIPDGASIYLDLIFTQDESMMHLSDMAPFDDFIPHRNAKALPVMVGMPFAEESCDMMNAACTTIVGGAGNYASRRRPAQFGATAAQEREKSFREFVHDGPVITAECLRTRRSDDSWVERRTVEFAIAASQAREERIMQLVVDGSGVIGSTPKNKCARAPDSSWHEKLPCFLRSDVNKSGTRFMSPRVYESQAATSEADTGYNHSPGS